MNRKSSTGYRLNKDDRIIPIARNHKGSWFFRLRGDFPGDEMVFHSDLWLGCEKFSDANNLNEVICNEDGNMYKVFNK